jgi:hypothetical protein
MDHLSVSDCVFETHAISFRLVFFDAPTRKAEREKTTRYTNRPLDIGDESLGWNRDFCLGL